MNEEIKITNSGWTAKLKHILKSSELSNLMINIFTVVEGDIRQKDYKNNFFQKSAKDFLIQKNFFTCTSENMNIFRQTKKQYRKNLSEQKH